jgi:hypothetical protein
MRGNPGTVLAAFVVNELAKESRESLLKQAIGHVEAGGSLLIVEPLARFVAPWWAEWTAAMEGRGGRADEWRCRPAVPAIVQRLARAAGLDCREQTGRTLWVPPGARRAVRRDSAEP